MMRPTTKGEAMRLVCSIEIAGHRHVLADLQRILNTMPLAAGQAREVGDEISERKAILRVLAARMKQAQGVIYKERAAA